MAELAPRDRLQPSLLDRLTDDQPDAMVESRDRRVLSMRILRKAVLRDIGWMLNATNLRAAQKEIVDYPLVADSVVNFGMPDMAGRSASGYKMQDLERDIRQALWDFEPRLVRSSVEVRCIAGRLESTGHNVAHFEVEGDLFAFPYPEHLFFKTALDLETGAVNIFDQERIDTRGASA
jgi:type VI secretion system protein ImpF